MVLDNSRHSFISLDLELESLALYLDIERTRFRDKFSYELNSNQVMDKSSILVPPLLIQPLAENAIIHGITPLQGKKGYLQIRIAPGRKGTLLCIVEDNGIGRVKSSEINARRTGHTSSGMSNVQSRLRILSSQFKISLMYEIHDLVDENGNSTGTRIEFEIPYRISGV